MRENDKNTVYGIHAVEEAMASGKEINKLIVIKGQQRHALVEQLLSDARKKGITVQQVPRESNAFPRDRNHQGIVAHISPVAYYQLENLLPDLFEKGLEPAILVLDHITDVRNFGAIARSAYSLGMHAIVIPKQGSVQVTDDAIKTSAGALMNIPVCRETNMKTVMELLNQSGVHTVGLTEKANKELPFVALTGPVAIIMGSEETGLSTDALKRCAALAKIPMSAANVGSLNVSVAAAIAMYERIRQIQ
jgi:23S rRNA (guanosine2251-2'-O)-methyltransferase